ncbi:MAG: hypothetical protein RR251_04425 [Hydrogenoanaerobacterium sp.]
MVFFKQIKDIKRDGTFYTKQNHIDYVKYLGTRPGAVFGEGLEHGLFGKYADNEFGDIKDIDDAANYVGEMFEQGKNVYRCVISLKEDEAVKLGYMEREKWVELLKTKMFDISDEYNMKFENAEYVGGFHFEKGHPHLQFNLWDKTQTIRRKILPAPQFEKQMENIRAKLSKEVYKDAVQEILKEKDAAEDVVFGGFSAFMRGISEQEISAAEQSLKGIFCELCDGKMLNIKVDDSYINKLHDSMVRVRQSVKEFYPKGALKYKYLPKECKEELDALSSVILEKGDFKSNFKDYLKSVKEYSAALGNSAKTIAEEQHKAQREVYKRCGNQILLYSRDEIRNSNTERQLSGVDITINEASIFDNKILMLGDEKGCFHFEDIENDARLRRRIEQLEKNGNIAHYGLRYELQPKFKKQVEEKVAEFKSNKLWGIDRQFIELKSFTINDLKASPKNENGKMEKRLPILLAVGFVKADGEVYAVTEEYKSCYKEQAERYKEKQFKKWFDENIDNDVKITVFDTELLHMAHDGKIMRSELEAASIYEKTEFRLRRLVAEDYITENNGIYTLMPKFNEELTQAHAAFKEKIFAVDKTFVKLKHFTIDDLKENTANKKVKKEDKMGTMEKRLPALLAVGFVVKNEEQYTITDEYKSACSVSSALYRQKVIEKQAKTELPKAVKLNLFDTEFAKLAIDNKFTIADVEEHSEATRLCWRLAALVKDNYVMADGANYTLTEKFSLELAATQNQFESGFAISYKDLAFIKLAENDAISKSLLAQQVNAQYLKWRIYGLEYKGLVTNIGDKYVVTDELLKKVTNAKAEFAVNHFDIEFVKLADQKGYLMSSDVLNNINADYLEKRMDSLITMGYITNKGDKLQLSSVFIAQAKNAICNYAGSFKINCYDSEFLKIGTNGSFTKEELMRHEDSSYLSSRLCSMLQIGLVRTDGENFYLSPQFNFATAVALQNFKIKSSDNAFLQINGTNKFTEKEADAHFELGIRLRELCAAGYITKTNGNYVMTDNLLIQTKLRLSEFADTRVSICDKAFVDLQMQMRGSFTMEDIEMQYPDNYNALSKRLEYLYVNNLFEKINDRYIAKQPLIDGINSAENVQRGIKRQAVISLLLDVFKIFTKFTGQQSAKQSNELAHKDLSKEAKKDIIADRISSSGMQWEENEI